MSNPQTEWFTLHIQYTITMVALLEKQLPQSCNYAFGL